MPSPLGLASAAFAAGNKTIQSFYCSSVLIGLRAAPAIGGRGAAVVAGEGVVKARERGVAAGLCGLIDRRALDKQLRGAFHPQFMEQYFAETFGILL